MDTKEHDRLQKLPQAEKLSSLKDLAQRLTLAVNSGTHDVDTIHDVAERMVAMSDEPKTDRPATFPAGSPKPLGVPKPLGMPASSA